MKKLLLLSLALLLASTLGAQFNQDSLNLRHTANSSSHFSLEQKWGNPYLGAATFEFALPHACQVNIKVFSSLGEELVTIIDGRLSEGAYEVDLDLSKLPSGLYFCIMKADYFCATQKLLVIKEA